jgi:hypothetical protein
MNTKQIDTDPTPHRYAENFMRLLGHSPGPWIVQPHHPMYGSYSGYHHGSACKHCSELFYILSYHGSIDMYHEPDGLVLYWGKHEYMNEKEIDLISRISRTASYMRLWRGQVICKRVSAFL